MHDAGVRGTRFNFVKRLVDFTPREVLDRDRSPHRAARLARRHLLRGRRPAGALGLLHLTSDDGGRRSHGPARRDQAGRRSRVRAVRADDARACEHLVEGQLPRAAHVTGPPAINGEKNAYRDVVPFARRLVETFPIACSGARTGRIPISRTTCPTMACSSTTCRTSRQRRSCSTSCCRQPMPVWCMG